MRLNIEERFFAESSRWKILARKMGWPENQAKGAMMTLWYHSQEAMMTHGDIDEICAWADVTDDQIKFVDCLCSKTVRYLISCQNGRYEISGNYVQIEAIRKVKDQRSKAGKASAAKRQQKGDYNEPLNSRVTNRQPMQGNAMQSNAMQKKEKEKKENSASASDTPKSKQKLKSSQKARTRTWEPDHPWSGTFALLNQLEAYKVVFDVPTDDARLTQHMQRYEFSCTEIEQHVYSFVNYFRDTPSKLKNPRGRLTTWLANQAKWKKDAKQKPETARDVKRRIDERIKADYFKTNGDFKDGW
jgi:hypothetical protein